MKSVLAVLLISIFFSLNAFSQQYLEHYRNAQAKYKAGDYKEYLNELKQADSLRPNHQIIMYNLAGAYALNDNPTQAFNYLHKAIIIKADLPFEKDEDFSSLKNSKEFQDLIREKQLLLKPVSHSETAFEISMPDTHFESIAYNPADKSFYMGSINKRKIIRYTSNGSIETFKKEGEDGLMAVLGMDVDKKNQILWVTTSGTPEMEGFDTGDEGKAAVFQYDLGSKKLVARYDAPEGSHFFGDLLITGMGILVSDSNSNQIFLIKEGKMSIWDEGDKFLNIQGLAFSENNNAVYVADYVRGLFKIGVSSKEVEPLAYDSDKFSLKGIDGLKLVDNTLISVQNGTIPNRVSRLILNISGNSIERIEILESNNSKFGEPTLGVIVNNWFYYVANSQWPLYKGNSFTNTNKIPVYVFRVMLK